MKKAANCERSTSMRRVKAFDSYERPAHIALNEWLAKNPEITLIDIKPVKSHTTSNITIFAIVDIPEKMKEESK